MNLNAVFFAIIKVAFFSLIVVCIVGLVLLFVVIPSLVQGGEVAVPNLISQSHQQAIQMVYNAGLQIDPDLEQKPSDVIPEGHVIAQEPLANFKVKRKKPVRLTLSVGNESIAVPDVSINPWRTGKESSKTPDFAEGALRLCIRTAILKSIR